MAKPRKSGRPLTSNAKSDIGATNETVTRAEIDTVFLGACNGCDPIEVEKKLGRSLSVPQLIKAFADGKAQLAWDIMAAFKAKAMEGDVKAIQWYAENILKKNIDAQTGSALIDCMTPEQRRDRIRELTKKLAING